MTPTTSATLLSLVALPDGSVLAGGYTPTGNNDLALFLFPADLSSRAEMPLAGIGGGTYTNQLVSLAADRDGAVYALAYLNDPAKPMGLGRLVFDQGTQQWQMDTSFASGGWSYYSPTSLAGSALANLGLQLRVQPDGSLLASANPYNSVPQPGLSDSLLVKVRTDGSPDPAWGAAGQRNFYAANQAQALFSLAFSRQGALAAAGFWHGYVNPPPTSSLARFGHNRVVVRWLE
jgi:hypothetical protein